MKKFKALAVVAVLALVGLFAAPLAAHGGAHAGSHFKSGDVTTVGKGEVMDSSAYLAGKTVSVAGIIKGDLYCAGQTIDITGTVEGDVICAGQTVTISGDVLGDVRVAGQTVSLSGPIARSVTAFGQTVTVNSDASVAMDATIFGTSLQIGGKIGRDAAVGGETVALAGAIGRDVTATTEQLSLSDAARIGGNLDYTSSKQLSRDGSAAVAGQTVRHDPPQDAQANMADKWAAQFMGVAYWFGAWAVLGLIMLAFCSRNANTTTKLMIGQGGWALLAGLGALLLTPIAAGLLMFTFLGIPAGIILLLLWVVALLMAYVYSALALGQWVTSQTGWTLKWPMVMSLGLGLVLLAMVMLIPYVGGMVSFAALVWGLGGTVLTCTRYFKSPQVEQPAGKKAKS